MMYLLDNIIETMFNGELNGEAPVRDIDAELEQVRADADAIFAKEKNRSQIEEIATRLMVLNGAVEFRNGFKAAVSLLIQTVAMGVANGGKSDV